MRKFEKHRSKDCDVSNCNKGQRRADGTMQDRFFVCTKRKVGAKKLRSAIFSSEDEAKQFTPCFLAELDNERVQPIQDAKVPIDATSPPKGNTANSSMDGLNKLLHDNRRQIKEEGVKRAEALHCELRKITRAPASFVRIVADEFATSLSSINGVIANLVDSFYRAERVTRDQDIQRRAFNRDKKCMKPTSKCSSYPYYEKKRHDILRERLRKWISARDHPAPFIAKGHTEGLVCAVDGIDLTDTGNTKILRKATLVHMYCSLRLLGTSRDDAEDIASTTFPPEARMTESSAHTSKVRAHFENTFTLRKYVGKYFAPRFSGNNCRKVCTSTYISKCSMDH